MHLPGDDPPVGFQKKLESTADLLRELNRRLDEPLTWEVQRQLVELLVEAVRVDTIETNGKRRSQVTVTYRFPTSQASTDNRTDGRADNNRSVVRVYSERQIRMAGLVNPPRS